MKSSTTHFLPPLLLAVILLLAVPTLAHQEPGCPEEYNYIEGNDRGPDRWGELCEEWRACSNGTRQSPIEFRPEDFNDVKVGGLESSYRPSSATIENRGHDIMVEWPDGGGLLYIHGKAFKLKQCHWHSPSEHSLDGIRFALELHLVHESQDKEIAVVGILYRISGRPDPFISLLEEGIESVSGNPGAAVEVGKVDPRIIGVADMAYLRYMGSLTTPPCTEGVIWTVLPTVRRVSSQQVVLLREAVGGHSNARPIQELNGRPIEVLLPISEHPNDDSKMHVSDA